MEQEIGTWDSVLLENLSEDSFINNIQQRYQHDFVYTYIGTSVVAVNPYYHISEDSLDIIRSYGSKGIFQLPPHIYGLTNLAFQFLKDQSEDQCILLTGESGSGKTESFKMIVNFLTHIQQQQHRSGSSRRGSRHQLCKQSSTGSNCSQQQQQQQHFHKHHTENNNSHRRSMSGCALPPSNIIICHNTTTTTSTTTRRQSPSPGAAGRIPIQIRAESNDRQNNNNNNNNNNNGINTRRNTRDKMVEFDFTHHKSNENISSITEDCIGGAAASDYKTSGRASACGFYAGSVPTKSCFRHQATATRNLNASGCRFCGHSRCIRAQSLEKYERDFLLKPDHNSPMPLQRGSCSNLVLRQQSTECQDIGIAGACFMGGSTHRLSHYDAHKLNQQQQQAVSMGAFAAVTAGAQTSPRSRSSRAPKTYTHKLRECVTCADVFLEAMGNAATLKNNNSSRYVN